MEGLYRAVLGVIADGHRVVEVDAQFVQSRQSVHAWLRHYESHCLEGLANWSHNPRSMPHPMPANVDAEVLDWIISLHTFCSSAGSIRSIDAFWRQQFEPDKLV